MHERMVLGIGSFPPVMFNYYMDRAFYDFIGHFPLTQLVCFQDCHMSHVLYCTT
jgi:hypothetical protein